MENKSFDNVSWLLGDPISNFCMSIVDDFVRTNADFHYKAGLYPRIIRSTDGKCCEWCSKLAGVYEYADVSGRGNDVFRRHRNCGCIVVYDPADGTKQYQNVHSKGWMSEEQYQTIRELQDSSDEISLRNVHKQHNNRQKQSEYVDSLLNNFSSRDSRWSRKTNVAKIEDLPDLFGRKELNCDITIREDAGIKTVIHEHLHARSISCVGSEEEVKRMYSLHYKIEEGSVELYAQEICKMYGIQYHQSYPQYVDPLRSINKLCNISWNDAEFAKLLFDQPVENRYNWLENEATKLLKLKNQEDKIPELKRYLQELQ